LPKKKSRIFAAKELEGGKAPGKTRPGKSGFLAKETHAKVPKKSGGRATRPKEEGATKTTFRGREERRKRSPFR